MLDNYLTGTVFILITTAAFLFLCLTYLKKSSPLKFAFAVLAYLIVTRPHILFYPPYGDVFSGPFDVAVWFVRHSLNYFEFLKQDSFTLGGVKQYPTSIYPYLLAVLMKVIPSVKAFLVISHLIVFSMAAAVISMMREVAKKIVHDEDLQMLSALVVLAVPLFQSMLELINMEMPCLFFAVLSVYFILKRRIGLASLAAVISLLIKAPGAIACGVVFLGAVFLFFEDSKERKNYWVLLLGILPCVLSLIKFYLRSELMGGVQQTQNTVGLFAGWDILKHTSLLWAFVVAFAGYIYFVIKDRGTNKKNFEISLMFCFTSLWFVLYLNFSGNLYRYILLMLPFYVFCFIFLLFKFVRNPRLIKSVMIFTVFVLCLGSFGWPYDSGRFDGGANRFERSLRYRNDLNLHRKVAAEIDKNYSAYTVVAPNIIAQSLNFREAGYVTNSLDVVVYGFSSHHESIREFKGIKELDLRKTIYVGLGLGQVIKPFDYPIDKNDKIVKRFEVADKSASLFIGGIAIEKMRYLVEKYRNKIN